MGHLVAFIATSLPSEETVLAHVEVETLETAISETDSSEWSRPVAAHLNPSIGFCLQMLHLAWCRAASAAVNLASNASTIHRSSSELPVEDGEPDHGLRLLLHPAEEVKRLDEPLGIVHVSSIG